MIDHVLDAEGYAPEDVLVVGDRRETDVALAGNFGCELVCVMTGDVTQTDIKASDVNPTAVAPSVGALAVSRRLLEIGHGHDRSRNSDARNRYVIVAIRSRKSGSGRPTLLGNAGGGYESGVGVAFWSAVSAIFPP